jgi:hypothetical protein
MSSIPDSLTSRATAVTRSARADRWRARVPRYLATAVLVVFLVIGIRAVFLPGHSSRSALPAPAEADPAAEDFALEFARAYLSYDAADPGARGQSLAPFVPHGLDPDAGFASARGSQQVDWIQVASSQPALAGGRVITVAAGVTTQATPIYLAVTVSHDRRRGLTLGGYPSFVGAPYVDLDPAQPQRAAVDDPAIAEVIHRVVANYLAGAAQNLDADLLAGAAVTLPTVQLHLDSVDQLNWTADSRAVLATISATGPAGSTYTLTYELGIASRERPYVDFIEVVPTGN